MHYVPSYYYCCCYHYYYYYYYHYHDYCTAPPPNLPIFLYRFGQPHTTLQSGSRGDPQLNPVKHCILQTH